MSSLSPTETAEKSLLSAKNRRCLFCELAKIAERLVTGGEKNKNNALQSYYTAFTLSKKC